MKCTNRFSHYKESLEKAINLNYHFLTLDKYSEIDNHDKLIILRHDVDLSLENALKMAKVENSLNIKATYFIRISAKYNAMFLPNIEILKSIIKLGHKIGLHYSVDIPRLNSIDSISYIMQEKRILEEIIQQKVSGICLHDPNQINKLTIEFNKYGIKYDAYSDVFMKKLKYISDSRAAWRDGCMCKNIGVFPKLYILTHPFWWYEKASCENY